MLDFFKESDAQNVFLKLASLEDLAGMPVLEKLPANDTDAASEKHVPAVTADKKQVTVKIGEIAHPMLDEHFITMICIETKKGGQFQILSPGDAPEAVFMLAEGDEFIAAYEYCNLHGLWTGRD